MGGWAVAGLLAPLAAGAQEAPPPPLPVKEIALSPYVEKTLSNGARLVVVVRPRQPVVALHLLIEGGTAADPPGRTGTSTMVASLLMEGTRSRSGAEIVEELDFAGVQLQARNDLEWTAISLSALPGDLQGGLEVLADVVRNPTFPEASVERLRGDISALIGSALASAEPVAEGALRRALFGEHPNGRSATPETIGAVDRPAIVDFHRTRYRPGHALFLVVGDVDPDSVAGGLESLFGGWEEGPATASAPPPPPPREGREVVLVHEPGSVHATLRVGHLFAGGGGREWTALLVANEVLGGSGGRLHRRLREETGWGFGAHSRTARMRRHGLFEAGMEVRNQRVDSALLALFEEIGRLRSELVPTEELARAAQLLSGSFPLRMETPAQIAEEVASALLLGFSKEDLERYRGRLSGVTPHEVRDAARRRLDPEQAVIVVVGDAARLLPQLDRFGPVTLLDRGGGELSRRDFEVTASDLVFDASPLRPGRWSYQILGPGGPVGEIERRLERVGDDRMKFTALLEIPGRSARQEVTFSVPGFQGLFASMRVTVQGETTMGTLRIEGDSLIGALLQERGPTRAIREAVPAGTMLGPMEELALWIRDLQAGERLRYPSLSLQDGRLANTTATVVGVEEVTIPAGTFKAFLVDIVGVVDSERIYLSFDAPHVLLKREPKGANLTIELKSRPEG